MDLGNNIEWEILIDAINFYKLKGFEFVNLDWTVPPKISNITIPVGRKNFFINEKVLVASGEQSFLNMIVNNNLKPGKYVGITPCFRDEPILDELHKSYFMKVELIDTLRADSLNNMIQSAKEFYLKYLDVSVIETQDEMYDIEDTKNRIELGSYGTRRYKNIEYVFGTGCALPRLTYAINLQ